MSTSSSGNTGCCPHGIRLCSGQQIIVCPKCEHENDLKTKIAELDQKMVEQRQALEEKERELLHRTFTSTPAPEEEKVIVGRQLVSLSMEEVTILMKCLKMPVTDDFIYDNMIDGNVLSVVEKMEDLVQLGYRLNPLKSKVLFYNLLSFKTEGVPDRFLDRLAAAATPEANLQRLVPRSSDVGKLSDLQRSFYSGNPGSDLSSVDRGLTPGRLAMTEVTRFLSTSNISTPEVSPRVPEGPVAASAPSGVWSPRENAVSSSVGGVAVDGIAAISARDIAVRALQFEEEEEEEEEEVVVISEYEEDEKINETESNQPEIIETQTMQQSAEVVEISIVNTVVQDVEQETERLTSEVDQFVESDDTPNDSERDSEPGEVSSSSCMPEDPEVPLQLPSDETEAVSAGGVENSEAASLSAEESPATEEQPPSTETIAVEIEAGSSVDVVEQEVLFQSPSTEPAAIETNADNSLRVVASPVEQSELVSSSESAPAAVADESVPTVVPVESVSVGNDESTAATSSMEPEVESALDEICEQPLADIPSNSSSTPVDSSDQPTLPLPVADSALEVIAPTVAVPYLSAQSSLHEILAIEVDDSVSKTEAPPASVASEVHASMSSPMSPMEVLQAVDALVSPVIPTLMNLFPTLQAETVDDSPSESPAASKKSRGLSSLNTENPESLGRAGSSLQLKPTASFVDGLNRSLKSDEKDDDEGEVSSTASTLPRTFSKRAAPLPRQTSRDTNSIPTDSPKRPTHNRRKSETAVTMSSSSYNLANLSPGVSMWTSAWGNVSTLFTEFSITPGVMSVSSSEHAIEALHILNNSPVGNVSEAAVITTLRDIRGLISNNRDSLKGVNDKGGVLLAAQVLSKYIDKIDVVRPLLTLLKLMSSELDHQKLFGVGLVSELLMDCLSRYGENETCVDDLCIIVYNMTANDCKHNIALLDSDGVCILLVDVLKQHKVIPSVCLNILKAMSNITIYEQCMKFLGKAGLCECIVEVLRSHMQDGNIVCSVCRIVRNLAVDEANELTLMREGIAEPLVLCLQIHEVNDVIITDVLDAMAHLSFHGVHQARYGALKACPLVVKLLRRHEYKDMLVEAGCGAIKNLAMDALNEVEFGRLGTCELLTDLLKLHERNEVLVTAICAAIKNITFDDENRAKFGAAGACELLLELACVHRKNERIRAAVKNLRANQLNRKRFQALGIR